MVFSKFFGADKTPVAGLDVSQDYITFVKLEKVEGSLKLEKLIRVPTPAGALTGGALTNPVGVGQILKEILETNDYDNIKINVAIPSNVPFMKTLTLPDLPIEELKIIAQDEASTHLPYSTSEANIDFGVLESTRRIEEGRKLVDVMIVAVQKSIAQKYLDMADEAKVRLNSIDISTLSMIKSLEKSGQLEEKEELDVSVLIGYENADITILSNGMPLFTHIASIGKKNIIENISTGLGIDTKLTEEFIPKVAILVPGYSAPNDPQIVKAATLVRLVYNNICTEISKAMHFYKSQKPSSPEISKIFLGGSGMCIKNADAFIANRLKLDAELANPFNNIIVSQDQIEPYNLPTLVTSVGLALKGM
jgi:type IV pilus assembly protein PilM